MITAKTLLKWVGPPAIILSVVFAVYSFGYNNGVKTTMGDWNAEKLSIAEQTQRLTEEMRIREKEHAQEVSDLETELREVEHVYSARIDDLASTYAQRLRLSEARATRYQQMAGADSTECRSLASHAAELDYTLEQGRHLVEEFRATLEQRESQLMLLGSQIKADRKLMEVRND